MSDCPPRMLMFYLEDHCLKGNSFEVKRILRDNPLIPFSNYCLELACTHGKYAIVQVLLGDPMNRFDPSKDMNLCVFRACIGGHHQMVKVLLKDKRVNFSENRCLMSEAVKKGHIEVVKVLCEDERMNKKAGLRVAVANNQITIANYLMWEILGSFLLFTVLIVGSEFGNDSGIHIPADVIRIVQTCMILDEIYHSYI